MLSEIMHWLLRWTQDTLGVLGPFGLFVLAIIESIFFPIPVEVLLLVLVIADPSWWWVYGLIAGIGSVIGAVIGYHIGRIGEQAILEKFFKKHIKKVHNLFKKYQVGAIFIAGFTPIPYKVFTIAAGVFYLDFKKFLLASLVARTARFLLVAGIAAWFATQNLEFSLGLVNALTILVVLLLGEAWVAKKLFFSGKRLRKTA